jgi:putative transposase
LDHIHLYIGTRPKYAVPSVVGRLKGKSAIRIARRYGGRSRNFNGENFWAPRLPRPPSISTSRECGRYIRSQEAEDECDHMKLAE